MFNLQGGELVIVLLLALVVLGPEKLPDAMRKAGQFYAEIRKMSSSFQKEFKDAVDQPMREVRETANMLRDSADFRKLADGERAEKPKSAEMAPAPLVAAADPTQSPVTDVPASVATPVGEAALEVAAESAAEAAAPPPSAFAPPTMADWGRARNGTPTAGAAVPAPAPPPPPPPTAAPVSEEPPA